MARAGHNPDILNWRLSFPGPNRRSGGPRMRPSTQPYACVAIADTARFSHLPPVKSGNSTGALPRATDV